MKNKETLTFAYLRLRLAIGHRLLRRLLRSNNMHAIGGSCNRFWNHRNYDVPLSNFVLRYLQSISHTCKNLHHPAHNGKFLNRINNLSNKSGHYSNRKIEKRKLNVPLPSIWSSSSDEKQDGGRHAVSVMAKKDGR